MAVGVFSPQNGTHWLVPREGPISNEQMLWTGEEKLGLEGSSGLLLLGLSGGSSMCSGFCGVSFLCLQPSLVRPMGQRFGSSHRGGLSFV